MRVVRTLVMSIALAGPTLMLARPADADGGAYIDLDRAYYLPGETAVAETYVTVPRNRQALLQRGPFYVFLVTGRQWPTEGEPLPTDAIRIGTLGVERDSGSTFELKGSLTIPDVPGDFYSLAVCNDPCTLTGFREPITGPISIVRTEREATLLEENQQLSGSVHRLKRETDKDLDELRELQARFDARETDRAYLAQQVNRLRRELDGARRAAAGRVPTGWAIAVAGSVFVVGAGGALLRRRRRAGSAVPRAA
jgi:hypothetical protein